jgi:hypothetical protein
MWRKERERERARERENEREEKTSKFLISKQKSQKIYNEILLRFLRYHVWKHVKVCKEFQT